MNENINLRFFNLRKYSIGVRLETIETYILKEAPALIFIDNIRDLIININSYEEVNNVLTIFTQLCDETGTHICFTLHENPGADNFKARGTIGTELQNKIETGFKISTDVDGRTKVEGLFTRNEKFEEIYFTLDDNGIPNIDTTIVYKKEEKEKMDDDNTPF
jgi:hypothetical protein